jgi:hypothetical protein
MLTRKHFIDFADFLIEEELKIIPRYGSIKTDIELILNDNNETLSNKQNKIYCILLEQMNKQHRELTAEIMLILDKNSLRFNKYRFKNYIISGVEKKQLNNLKNTAINNNNKVGNMT